VLKELRKRKIPHSFIHSGQHYSEKMDRKIMADLNMPTPDFNLHVGSGTHAVQTGRVMERVEKICLKTKPELMLVHGDTNTTLAGALAAKKLHIPVGHVEAGLRSFDYMMPEEINRILTDRISDVLFAPTKISRENLLKEGIDDKIIIVTGNTVVDALIENVVLVKRSKILKRLSLKKNSYVLLTAHREENVDDQKRFRKMMGLLKSLNRILGVEIIWPIHPRAEKILGANDLGLAEGVRIVEPVGYLDMLALIKAAKLVLTDSGGIQEEAYVLKKPLVTLRSSTERPETLTANFIVDLDVAKLKRALRAYEKKEAFWTDDLGDGNASIVIVEALEKLFKN